MWDVDLGKCEFWRSYASREIFEFVSANVKPDKFENLFVDNERTIPLDVCDEKSHTEC